MEDRTMNDKTMEDKTKRRHKIEDKTKYRIKQNEGENKMKDMQMRIEQWRIEQ